MEISLSPLETEEGTLAMSAIRDISEPKRGICSWKRRRWMIPRMGNANAIADNAREAV